MSSSPFKTSNTRIVLSVLVLVVTCVAACPSSRGSARAASFPIRFQTFPVSNFQAGPTVAGDKIFWSEDHRSSNGKAEYIVLYSSSTVKFHPISLHRFGLASAPANVSANEKWVTVLGGSQGHAWLWVFNRLTRAGKRITVPGPTLGATHFNGDTLFGSRVGYWIDTRLSNSGQLQWQNQVYEINLQTGAKHRAFSLMGACADTDLSFSGTAWFGVEATRCDSKWYYTDVYRYDLVSKRLSLLTHNHASTAAIANGRYVTWIHHKLVSVPNTPQPGGEPGQVVLMDRQTSSQKIVSMGTGRTTLLTMTSRLLAWSPSGSGKLAVYDLARRRRYVVSSGPAPGPQDIFGGFGQGSGKTVCWYALGHAHGPKELQELVTAKLVAA